MLLLRSNGTLLHMKDCIITFVKLIISKKHNFILYNALTNRDSPNFPLPSNPLPQIVTSNPRLQPDTHFAVDMFPYKKTEPFQKSGFKSKPPKKPGNTPLSGTYLSFLDIKTTVSTVVSVSKGSSFTSSPSTGTGKLNTIFFIQLPSFLFSGNISIRSIKAFINSFCSASVAEW